MFSVVSCRGGGVSKTGVNGEVSVAVNGSFSTAGLSHVGEECVMHRITSFA
jgi:hypothetical protein